VADNIQPVKGMIIRLEDGGVVDSVAFQYNPTQWATAYGADWAFSDSAGQFLPSAQLSKFRSDQITIQLMLYDYEAGDPLLPEMRSVRQSYARLRLFCSPTSRFSLDNPHQTAGPRAKLALGRDVFNVVVTGISEMRMQFDRKLNTRMGTAGLTLRHVSFGIEEEVAFLNRIRSEAGV